VPEHVATGGVSHVMAAHGFGRQAPLLHPNVHAVTLDGNVHSPALQVPDAP
jgi:hypothetical protein